MAKKNKLLYIILLALLAMQACNTAKYVPEGEYLLNKVDVKSNVKGIDYFDLSPYLKQTPNYRIFGFYKFPLHVYSISGRDTSKFYNRLLRKIGEPPVIYDTTLTSRTEVELRRVFVNKGYVHADVTADVKKNGKKLNVTYVVHPDEVYRIGNYRIELADSLFSGFSAEEGVGAKRKMSIDTASLTANTLVKKGLPFDMNVLDEERSRVAGIFRQNGYYNFNKEYIGFVADTLRQQRTVDLEMVFYPFVKRAANGKQEQVRHSRYVVASVEVFAEYDPLQNGLLANYKPTDSLTYDGCGLFFGPRGRYIKPQILMEAIHLRPGMVYDEQAVTMTYNAMARLSILRNVNIHFYPYTENDSTKLRCTITCFPEKRQGFATEIEGTNTYKGSLGAAASLSYLHRNIFRGAELFSVKVQGAFDGVSSKSFDLGDNYYEIGGEASLTFPRFLAPFLSQDFKRKSKASTQLSASYTYQQYPKFYQRTILSGGLKYIWQDQRNSFSKQTLDLLEVSYVHFPFLSKEFYDKLPIYAREYSFQDQFIASIGYSFTNTNFNPLSKSLQPVHSLRASVETAGNLLNLAANILKVKPNELGQRKIFDTYYAQYAKANVDYSKTVRFDSKNSFAWHVGGGVAVPYGNSEAIPIQKRFYSGGPNSVRGWNVRELGPGSFNGENATFYNHSGDIRFDANLEYRSKVFWKFELAAFVDAGNIWTIKDYKDQPGGTFRLGSFYKQIAGSWGLGLRLDFDFVLIRLDCGWKAYDPADNTGRTKWQITDPFNFSRNTAWHIAVGYPF